MEDDTQAELLKDESCASKNSISVSRNEEASKELVHTVFADARNDTKKLDDSSFLSLELENRNSSRRFSFRVQEDPKQSLGRQLQSLGVELMELEARLGEVEKTLATLHSDLPPVVQDLKRAVDAFRTKLQIPDDDAWAGACRDCVRDGLPYWKHVQYRRRMKDEAMRVFDKFMQDRETDVVKDAQRFLCLPSFNNWVCEDWEVLVLLQHMFTDLGLASKFTIEKETLRNFLCAVYLNYNEVPFHNFLHAFCVTQMMYGIICKCNLNQLLGDLDVLVLMMSCVCHDLDHPGFNNLYQINAGTELAIRYNDISPLENHHCSVAFQILEKEECNILKNVTQEDFKRIREGVIRCILATDMARHNEILEDFGEVMEEFDFENRAHINLLSMILIKVADISNEARPLDIAEPWLECLLQEFFNQSDLEKMEGLPVSPFMDRDKVTKPSSQCSFIGFVLLPLFEALGTVLPELDELMIQPVRDVLEHYRRLNESCKKLSDLDEEIYEMDIADSSSLSKTSTQDNSSDGAARRSVQKTESSSSIKSRGSRSSFRSKSIGDVEAEIIHLLEDVSLTETEVDVMERTSRFKISTKSVSRRNSTFDHRASIDSRMYKELTPQAFDQRMRNENEKTHHKSYHKKLSLMARIRKGLSLPERDKNGNSSRKKDKNIARKNRAKDDPKTRHKGFQVNRQKMSFKVAPQKTDSFRTCRSSLSEEDLRISDSNELTTSASLELLEGRSRNDQEKDSRSSPTLSEKFVDPCNSNLSRKKYSLSLDFLPKRNGKKDSSAVLSLPGNQKYSLFSKDGPHSNLSLKKTSDSALIGSPKSSRKKPGSPKALLFKSFSLRKKSHKKEKWKDSTDFDQCDEEL